MKFFPLVFLFFALSFSLSAQVVPEVQRPLISKVAATWCPPCGGWGWDFFEHMIVDNDSLATVIVAHHSGDLVNDVSKAFSDNFMAPYQPYFYLNIEDQGVNASNTAEKRTAVMEAVVLANMQSPIVGANIKAEIENGILSITSEIDFFQLEDDLYIGYYVVENGIVNNQEGQGQSAIHDKVLRASFAEEPFGVDIPIAVLEDGPEIEAGYSITLNNDWVVENLEIIAIMWKKVNDQYLPINTSWTDEITIVSDVDDLALEAGLQILPNQLTDTAQITVELSTPLDDADLSIYDAAGRLIKSIFTGRLNAGKLQFNLKREMLSQSGLYFVVLSSAGKKVSQKLTVQ